MTPNKLDCLCCKKELQIGIRKTYPECGFRGHGWDGTDAHWRGGRENSGVSNADFGTAFVASTVAMDSLYRSGRVPALNEIQGLTSSAGR